MTKLGWNKNGWESPWVLQLPRHELLNILVSFCSCSNLLSAPTFPSIDHVE